MSAEDILNQQTTSRQNVPAGATPAGFGPKTLPPDIAREYMGRVTSGHQVSVQQAAQQIALPQAADTLSVFTTLPANAGYFNYGNQKTVNISGLGAIQNNVQIFSQVVPQGRVALVNSVRVNIDSWVEKSIPTVPFTFTLLRNGNAEVFNQNIFVQAFDSSYPVFLAAGPGDIISVNVSFDFSSITPPYVSGPVFLVHVQGVMMLQNDLPVPYTGLKSATVKVQQ